MWTGLSQKESIQIYNKQKAEGKVFNAIAYQANEN